MRKDLNTLFNSFSKKLRELVKKDDPEPKDCEYVYYVRDENKKPTNYALSVVSVDGKNTEGIRVHDHLSELLEGIIFEELQFLYADQIKQGQYPEERDIFWFYADIMDDMDRVSFDRFKEYAFDPKGFWEKELTPRQNYETGSKSHA